MAVLLRVVDHGQILKITEIVELVVVRHDPLDPDLAPHGGPVLRGLEARLQLLPLDPDQEGGVGLLLPAGGFTEHVIRTESELQSSVWLLDNLSDCLQATETLQHLVSAVHNARVLDTDLRHNMTH